ncbi:MAG: VCBS repeat-containing protein, partial [Roseibacillus sp.]|nr:VCBS repeat-containing protein [Roseibacillus sp.]
MNTSLFPRLLAVVFLAVLAACKERVENSPPNRNAPAEAWSTPTWKQVTDGLEESLLSTVVTDPGNSEPHFEQLGPEATGIEFHNQLNQENIKNYLLTGAGLAIGDVDANGLPDLFLVSQDGPNRLYLQVSPWRFVDRTKAAGIRDTKSWGSGAAFADLDNNGWLDLYVCNKGAHDELYLNQGNGIFKGGFFGRGDASLRAPTMAAFSDYDRDGDMDLFVTNFSRESNTLYRNDGGDHFTDSGALVGIE